MRKEQKKRSRASGIPQKKKYRSPKASDRRERERRMSEPQPPLGGRSVAERVETATRRETSVASVARGGGDLRRWRRCARQSRWAERGTSGSPRDQLLQADVTAKPRRAGARRQDKTCTVVAGARWHETHK